MTTKIASNRSRTKKTHLLSTQAKVHNDGDNDLIHSSDGVDNINNEATNLNGSEKDNDGQNNHIASFEQFETDSNYR